MKDIADDMKGMMDNLAKLVSSMNGMEKIIDDALCNYKDIPEVQELISIKEHEKKRMKNGGEYDPSIIKRYENIIKRVEEKEEIEKNH